MKKILNVCIPMMVLMSTIIGCGSVSKTTNMQTNKNGEEEPIWLVPPEYDPDTGKMVDGIRYHTYENKSRDGKGQDLVTQREFVVNYRKKKVSILESNSSAGPGIMKGAVEGAVTAAVDNVTGIPRDFVYGRGFRPNKNRFQVSNGSSSGSAALTGPVSNSNTAEGGAGGEGGEGGAGGRADNHSRGSTANGGRASSSSDSDNNSRNTANGGRADNNSRGSTAYGGEGGRSNATGGRADNNLRNTANGGDANANAQQGQHQGQEQGQHQGQGQGQGQGQRNNGNGYKKKGR